MKYSKDFIDFIDKLICTYEFWNAQYYLLSMKKAPHGGVFAIQKPNYFIKHYNIPFFRFYIHGVKIPLPVKKAANLGMELFQQSKCDIEELLLFCFWDYQDLNELACKEYLVNCCDIITPKSGKKEYTYSIDKDQPEQPLKNQFDYNPEALFSLLVMLLSNYRLVPIDCLNDITRHEKLLKEHDKYGLIDVTNANFTREGFSLNGQYYLYNIFFDTSIGETSYHIPKIIELMQKAPSGCQIWMRCDAALSVPDSEKIQIATTDMQKWRGTSLDFSCIEKVIKSPKEIIIHADDNMENKLLLSVLKEDSHYSVSVEQIWHPKFYYGSRYIMANFIHGCYYAKENRFDHIDFSINQFTDKDAAEKNLDAYNLTGTPIEKYGEDHYKVWCLKGDDLNIKLWANLVYAALDFPFRSLFLEMVHGIEIS